eukprot:TRINITY_DN14109_c1_g1_i3.p1 TRINITY_DN14109_c1_g1~~TRINITY_DN14109_c1_g1_i3.p1  ORF type:complete len:911 (+),score=255.71 TRINITY_DN14109_c1_g1_i3:89-2821(+)
MPPLQARMTRPETLRRPPEELVQQWVERLKAGGSTVDTGATSSSDEEEQDVRMTRAPRAVQRVGAGIPDGYDTEDMPAAGVQAKAAATLRRLREGLYRQGYVPVRLPTPPAPRQTAALGRRPFAHLVKASVQQQEQEELQQKQQQQQQQQMQQHVDAPQSAPAPAAAASPVVPPVPEHTPAPPARTAPARTAPARRRSTARRASAAGANRDGEKTMLQSSGGHFSHGPGDRRRTVLPKQLLRQDIDLTQARIVHCMCGRTAEDIAALDEELFQLCSTKRVGLLPKKRRDHTEPPPQTRPSTPLVQWCRAPGTEYDGAYRRDTTLNAREVPVWIQGRCRIRRHGGAWRVERSVHTYVEAREPHGGELPSADTLWDTWDGPSCGWVREEKAVAVPSLDRATGVVDAVRLKCHQAYAGRYTVCDGVTREGLPVWRCGSLQLASADGYWRFDDTDYSFFETRAAGSARAPEQGAEWDRWDCGKLEWVPAPEVAVASERPAPAAAPGDMPETDDDEKSKTFVTQQSTTALATVLQPTAPSQPRSTPSPPRSGPGANVVSESLIGHLPPVRLAQISVDDVRSGRLLKRNDNAYNLADALREHEPDEEAKEANKMVETLLFSFHANMRIADAKRVLGLTYRFDETESRAGEATTFPTFARAYCFERLQFHSRCTRELRRMAKERRGLFPKKREILNSLLENTPDARSRNPHWREARNILHSEVFHGVQSEFRQCRRDLLKLWFGHFKCALPRVLTEGCNRVVGYLESIFAGEIDIVLDQRSFFDMCQKVLQPSHFLCDDVLRLLWGIKRVFQVGDEEFCEYVRKRTASLWPAPLDFRLPKAPQVEKRLRSPSSTHRVSLTVQLQPTPAQPKQPDACLAPRPRKSIGFDRAGSRMLTPPAGPQLPPIVPQRDGSTPPV